MFIFYDTASSAKMDIEETGNVNAEANNGNECNSVNSKLENTERRIIPNNPQIVPRKIASPILSLTASISPPALATKGVTTDGRKDMIQKLDEKTWFAAP